MELMQKATSVATLIFVLSSMLAMGLGFTVSKIITPLRNVRLVVLSLLANFVLMPLAALGLATLLRLDEPLGVGLLREHIIQSKEVKSNRHLLPVVNKAITDIKVGLLESTGDANQQTEDDEFAGFPLYM